MIAPEILLKGYRRGIFPMADESGKILWFSPDPRGILPLEAFHVPHGLKGLLHRRPFEIRINHDFNGVIRACASRYETWINEDIIRCYSQLHDRGFAHSVEAWNQNGLVGGLYGVSVGAVFFGESMFYREAGASKVALHALVEHLTLRRYSLLDIQWVTPHLRQFGAVEISREDYHRRLSSGLALERCFSAPPA